MLKKYFSLLCLIISTLIFTYTFYKSEIFSDGFKRDYYLNYYIISSICIFLSIISFFLNKKIKLYAIIILSTIFFSIYSFEIFLLFDKKQDVIIEDFERKKKIYKKSTGKNFDIRTHLSAYKDLKKDSKDLVLAVHPSLHINKIDNYNKKSEAIFPLSGISNSPTMTCNDNGYYSIYQSDRYGFNNPDAEWEKEEIDYLLIGDSFAHGNCVDRPHDIASVLRTLSKRSVLNLGYSGNGPLIQYATLKEYVKKNIKNIVWIYYDGNDIVDLNRELGSVMLRKYLDKNFSQNLIKKQKQIDKINKHFLEKKMLVLEQEEINNKNIELFSFFLNFLKLSKTRSLFISSTNPKNTKLYEILQMSKDLSDKNNSNFYFIYLPANKNFLGKKNTHYDALKEIISSLGIYFIDINKEVFEKEKNPMKLFPFETLLHYNNLGYLKISQAIYRLTSKK